MTLAPVAPTRVTPEAVLVYDGPPRTPEWFAVRRDGITATDLPAIVNAYEPGYRWAKTPLHVWLEKRGESPDEDRMSYQAEAGIRAEPMISQWWSDDHHTTLRETGVLARLGEEWMRCSPDRLVDTCPDGDAGPNGCGLQVKNRNAYVAGRFSDTVPDDVLAQVGWEMAVTGWPHIHVAVLIGGNTPVWHRVDRDQALEDLLVGEAARVWAAVRAGVPPQIDASAALARLLDALYPDRDGGHLVDPDQAADLYQRYRLAAELEKRGRDMKAMLRDEVVCLMEAGEEELWASGQPKPLATYREAGRTNCDVKRLAKEMPNLYALLVRQGLITTTSYRELRWTKQIGDSIVQ